MPPENAGVGPAGTPEKFQQAPGGEVGGSNGAVSGAGNEFGGHLPGLIRYSLAERTNRLASNNPRLDLRNVPKAAATEILLAILNAITL